MDDRVDDHGHGDDSRDEELHDHEARVGEAHGHDVEGLDRVTAPMQSFGTREVGVGFVVLAVGLAVTFGLPFLLT